LVSSFGLRSDSGSLPTIIVTVVAFNMIGDAIRDSLDVRLQRA
jgi:ABC-type dipeptide/oligopeptide/nickel transport system permease subunit